MEDKEAFRLVIDARSAKTNVPKIVMGITLEYVPQHEAWEATQDGIRYVITPNGFVPKE